MKFPKEIKYTCDHEWLCINEEEVYVGITDYAQDQLGEIIFIDISTEGETIEKDGVFGSIEAVKTVSDLLMPVKARVLAVNPLLEDHPELVNTDPYGNGWIVKVKLLDLSQLDELLTADNYKEHVGY